MDFSELLDRESILELCCHALHAMGDAAMAEFTHSFADVVAGTLTPQLGDTVSHWRSSDPLLAPPTPIDGLVTVCGDRAWCTVTSNLSDQRPRTGESSTHSFLLARDGSTWRIESVTSA